MIEAGRLFNEYHEESYGSVVGELTSLPGLGDFVGPYAAAKTFDEFVAQARSKYHAARSEGYKNGD